MKVTTKSIAALSAALICCIVLTLALTFWGRGGSTETETVYYLTNYSDPERLQFIGLENESGMVVLANLPGERRAIGQDGLNTNTAAVEACFQQTYRLPLRRLIEGASSADAQYGLTEPRAEVTLQDISGNGLLLYLGAAAPDGSGVYAGIAGDDRVFVMDADYAKMYLQNVISFYDLSLYPSLEGEGIKALKQVEMVRGGEIAYAVELLSCSDGGNTVFAALTQPYRLLLGSEQVRRELLQPLRELHGTALAPEALRESMRTQENTELLRLTYADGSRYVLSMQELDNGDVCVYSEELDLAVLLPEKQIAFRNDTAADLVGTHPISLNLSDVRQVKINDVTWDIMGQGSAMQISCRGSAVDLSMFRDTVYSTLGRISIQGVCEADTPLDTQLASVEVTSSVGETIQLHFYGLDGRRCAIRVGETTAFWCDRMAVDELVRYVSAYG